MYRFHQVVKNPKPFCMYYRICIISPVFFSLHLNTSLLSPSRTAIINGFFHAISINIQFLRNWTRCRSKLCFRGINSATRCIHGGGTKRRAEKKGGDQAKGKGTEETTPLHSSPHSFPTAANVLPRMHERMDFSRLFCTDLSHGMNDRSQGDFFDGGLD